VEFLHLLGIDADGVAARAEAAVNRAGVERQEQRFVDETGMNCRRSGSSYGLAQSISDNRYGETRTLIGAFSKPRRASSRNSADASVPSAAISFCTLGMVFFACHL
jgi:hypothetical protein